MQLNSFFRTYPFIFLKFSSLNVIVECWIPGAVGSYKLHGRIAKNECNYCFRNCVTGLWWGPLPAPSE